MGDRVGEEDSGKGILKSGQKGAKQSAVKFEDITAEIGVMRRSSLDLTKPRLAAREVAQGLANLRRQAGVKVTVSVGNRMLGGKLSQESLPRPRRRRGLCWPRGWTSCHQRCRRARGGSLSCRREWSWR